MDDSHPCYDDLDETLKFAVELITEGSNNRTSQFHIIQIATVDPSGAPNVRSVVLRGFESETRTLRFHTDRFSLKFASLQADARIAAHFYDRGRKIQIRLKGTAKIAGEGPIVEQAWANSQPMSKACYGSSPPPGSTIDEGGSYDAEARPDEPNHGRSAFRIVLITYNRLEWLYLKAGGHRRAAFAWNENDVLVEKVWLVP